MKPFVYVNAASEHEAVAALATERNRFLPIAGGTDLIPLMKDFILSPERLVNVKNLDRSIVSIDGGLRIGAAARLVDVVEHVTVRRLYPALLTAAEGVGTPQIRNQGTVGGNLLQRPRCWYYRNEEFHCLKKGGSRCHAVEGENKYHAIFGDGPCPIVHPSSLAVPIIAYHGRFRVAGPNGAREIDAGDFFELPSVNLYGETVLQPNEILTHIMLPAPFTVLAGSDVGSATYEVRFRQSSDWPLGTASVSLGLDGSTVRWSWALWPLCPGGSQRLSVSSWGGLSQKGRRRTRRFRRLLVRSLERKRLQDSDCEDGGEAANSVGGRPAGDVRPDV